MKRGSCIQFNINCNEQGFQVREMIAKLPIVRHKTLQGMDGHIMTTAKLTYRREILDGDIAGVAWHNPRTFQRFVVETQWFWNNHLKIMAAEELAVDRDDFWAIVSTVFLLEQPYLAVDWYDKIEVHPGTEVEFDEMYLHQYVEE